MAQVSSVAREPSMEEILASIRRIIEDSDVTRQVAQDEPSGAKPAETSTARGEVAPFRRPAFETVEPAAASLQRNYERPLLHEKTAVPVTKPEPAHSSVVSAVAAAIEKPLSSVFDSNLNLRGSLENEVVHNEYGVVKPVPANDAAVVMPLNSIVEPAAELSVTSEKVAEAEIRTDKKADNGDLNIREKVEQSVENDIQKIISEMMEKQPESIEAKPSVPLASATTKQQVTASFTELTEAVRQERIRSLEEQAEAILRPMLQKWLDENLPTMVERLVREEIERMVRGEQH
jgi:cell pole-organizing protein PopZ